MSKVTFIDRTYRQRTSFPYTFPIDFTVLQTVAATSKGGSVEIIGASLGRVTFLSGLTTNANRVIIRVAT